MKRVGIIVQARMSSTRLPGKVLADVGGRPMLALQLERLKLSRTASALAVATTNGADDTPIVECCEREGVPCTRGSLEDVLDRYYQAAKPLDLDVVVRITADCPVIDPAVIDAVVEDFLRGGADYVCNTTPPERSTYPDGMDVEVFSFAALERAWREAKLPSEREHVTFYFWKTTTGKFTTRCHEQKRNLSHLRLTVDYPQDLEVTRAIFAGLYKTNPRFTMDDIVGFLDKHPEIARLNAEIKPNQGWLPSLARDKEFLKNEKA